MNRFISAANLFELSIPNGWEYSYEEGIYSFYNTEIIEGVLQISCAYNKDKSKIINLELELRKEQKIHPTAHIIELSEYDAIHYALNSISTQTLQYFWITGSHNIKLFCSLIINSNQDERKLDENYIKTVDFLNTLKINLIN